MNNSIYIHRVSIDITYPGQGVRHAILRCTPFGTHDVRRGGARSKNRP